MKDDKENTRPKDRKVEIITEDGDKIEKSKEKKETMTKVKLLASIANAATYRQFWILIVSKLTTHI